MNTTRRRPLVVSALVVASMVIGCAIQNDTEPRAIEPSLVPFDLLGTSTSTTTSATTASTVQRPLEVEASIFLVDSDTDLLAEVGRMVSPLQTAQAALQQLLTGPTEAELDQGLNSAIARSTVLLGVEGPDAEGVVTVDLSDDLRNIGGQGQRLALAQVVFTATATPEVSGVLFSFEGEPSEVPNGLGVSTTEPLDRADFATFDPFAPAPPPPPDTPAADGG